GGDYGHVLLYTEQIVEKGEVPIYFPYHQLGGLRFQSMPGLPLLLSALSFTTGLESIPLAYYALAWSALEIVTLFVFARLLIGEKAALLAALILALLPSNLEMLAWSGYSNIFALALIPLVGWALIKFRASRLPPPEADRPPADAGQAGSLGWAALAGLLVVGIVLSHHLSALVVVLALAAFALGDMALARFRPQVVAAYLFLASFGLALGLPILVHVLDSYFGADAIKPALGEGLWVTTKITFARVQHTFTPVVVLVAGAGLVLLLLKNHSSAAGRLLILALMGTTALLGYAWVFSLNFFYIRALHFAPIVLAPAAAYAIWHTHKTFVRPLLVALVIGYLTLVGMFRAERDSDFYQVLTPDSYAALTWLGDNSQENDVVLTDYCLAFLVEFISQRPTVAAFYPELLASAQEESIAAAARTMLLERRSQRRLFDEYGIDYVVFNGDCRAFNALLVLRNLNAEPFLRRVVDFGPVTIYENLRAVARSGENHAAP
ncbi:MAG: hypothetical protein Q8P22_07165, partial [Chloroflexota bacterium]|nr:hypothetical protein [Chloroflexota bacterium]